MCAAARPRGDAEKAPIPLRRGETAGPALWQDAPDSMTGSITRGAARILGLSLLVGAASCAPGEPLGPDPEAPPASVYAHDTAKNQGFIPNPAFVPVKEDVALQRSALRTEGEVIVIEGDPRFVTSNGVAFGITEDNTAAIIQEVLANYPDEFDTIQIHLSFIDEAHAGTAYYQSIKNTVAGIGIETFDNRGAYGLGEDGRLTGFVNMNGLDMWGSLDSLTQPRGPYYSVIAQELSHRWLMFLQFKDRTTGDVRDDLKGRQDAHWSALVHAYGSCQDGIWWEKLDDNRFQHMGESDRGWAPADRYAMGIIPKEDVEPWFYLVEATLNGSPLTATSHRDIPRGAIVNGRAVEITIDDVINVHGPRNPPAGTETPYYRAAFVLITAPGQSEAEWRPYLETVQEVQRTFPETWKEWTNGAGALCTKVTERCPEPRLGLERAAISDGNDGFLAPGETFELEITLRNDGIGTTENTSVALTATDAQVQVLSQPQTLPSIDGHGATAVVPGRFSLSIPSDVPCGTSVRVIERATTAEGPSFSAPIDLAVGTKQIKVDPLNEAPDWRVNADGDDDATVGQWELGLPELVTVLGFTTQPVEDHTPGDGKLAFMTGPAKGGSFSSNDLDGGKTTLDSPVFALGDARDPTLVFYAWRFAKNLANQGGPIPVDGADLVVSASNDGGETWTELGRVTEDTKEWTRVTFRIKDAVELTNRVRFRFVITDPSAPGTVEAGIDDLEVIDYLDGCEIPGQRPDAGPTTPTEREDGGCSCTAHRAEGSGAWLALGVVALLVARRRRAR